jgi:hypothetical protein
MKKMLCIAVLCAFAASPAMADLFGFSYDILQTSYDGAGNFSAGVVPGLTLGSVTRLEDPTGKVIFFAFGAPGNNADFQIDMTISNVDVTPGYADGSGTFLITDVEGNTLSGNLSGTWTKENPENPIPSFRGALSGVTFTDVPIVDNMLKGDLGNISMAFSKTPPWEGLIVELTASGLWFDGTWSNVTGGGVVAGIVPVPGAVLLGLLGFGFAGMKLRRFV